MSISFTRVLAAALAVAALPGCGAKAQPPAPAAAGTMSVTVFNTPTHGLAIAVRTPAGRIYLVDAGGATVGYDPGRDTVGPWLKANGISEIHGMVLSHPDQDHYAGAAWLLQNFKVHGLVDGGMEGPEVHKRYLSLRTLVRERGGEYSAVAAGDLLAWDPALKVEVLSPPRGGLKPPGSEGKELANDNSLVLRIEHGKQVFLLPGDIKGIGRDHLLATYRADTLKCTYMVAPHHGFSHGKKFAEITKPEVVVVSCKAEYPGKDIVSPGKEAQAFFGGFGAKVYVTAFDGTIETTSDGESIRTRAIR